MLLTFQKILVGVIIFLVIAGSLAAYLRVQKQYQYLETQIPLSQSVQQVEEIALSSAIEEGLALFLIFGVFGITIVIALHILVIKPLYELVAYVTKAAEEQFTIRIPTRGRNTIGTVINIFKQMVSLLQQEQQRAQSISKIKSEFIRVVAHKFRTPLSEIKWALQVLKEKNVGETSEDTKEILGKMARSNERFIKLIDDVLIAAEIEEGRYGYKFAACDLGALVRSKLDEMAPMARAHQISILLEPLPRTLPPMKIDAEKIGLVIRYLVENAVYYSPPVSEVRVRVDLDDKFARVTVADSGIGISETEQQHIFLKFFRGEGATRRETEGLGLSLFIAQNIIQRHGGSITVASKKGRGSAFSFTIPHAAKLLDERQKKFEEFVGKI